MRAPIGRTHLRELVELGRFLDVRVDAPEGETLYKAAEPILWSETARALVVLAGFDLGRAQPIEPRKSTAERVYSRWAAGRAPSRERSPVISLPDAPWVELGRALTVGYRSDKFHARGEAKDYEHRFGPRVVAASCSQGNRSVLVIRGGSLRLTPHGIEG